MEYIATTPVRKVFVKTLEEALLNVAPPTTPTTPGTPTYTPTEGVPDYMEDVVENGAQEELGKFIQYCYVCLYCYARTAMLFCTTMLVLLCMLVLPYLYCYACTAMLVLLCLYCLCL